MLDHYSEKLDRQLARSVDRKDREAHLDVIPEKQTKTTPEDRALRLQRRTRRKEADDMRDEDEEESSSDESTSDEDISDDVRRVPLDCCSLFVWFQVGLACELSPQTASTWTQGAVSLPLSHS